MPALVNAKHERFSQEVAKGRTATDAYRDAGYAPNQPSAARLLSNVMVQARIAEIKERGAVRTEITLASLIDEAADIQKSALEAKNHSAAVSALTAKAKLAGLWVEKSETENVNTNYVVSSDPIDNVEDWEAEHSPKH